MGEEKKKTDGMPEYVWFTVSLPFLCEFFELPPGSEVMAVEQSCPFTLTTRIMVRTPQPHNPDQQREGRPTYRNDEHGRPVFIGWGLRGDGV